MACICGCDADDHLHNLPSRPSSPNTFFENFWAPNFVELLTSRLCKVLEDSEPSKRALWKKRYGGDAQDTIPPRHKWARRPKLSDKSRGPPISRLPTPDFDKIEREEELWRNRIRVRADSTSSRKRTCDASEDEESQIPLPPAKRSMHASYSWPHRSYSNTVTSNAFDFDYRVPDSSKKLTTRSLPLQFDQGYPASNTPSSYGQHSERPESFHDKYIRFRFRRPISKAFDRSKRTKESRASARRKVKSKRFAETLEQVALTQACLSNGLLRQRSTSLVETPISSPDRPVNASSESFTYGHDHASQVVPLDEEDERVNKEIAIWWSNLTSSRHTATQEPILPASEVRRPTAPTHYIPNRHPQFEIPESAPIYTPGTKREPPPEGKHELSRPKLEVTRSKTVLGSSIIFYGGANDDYGGPNLTKDVLVYEAGGKPADVSADDCTHADGSTEFPLQAPSVPSMPFFPKTSTHYIPEKETPLGDTDSSEETPAQHKGKERTWQIIQEESEQLRESDSGKIEATRDEKNSLYGVSLERGGYLLSGSPPSTSQSDNAEEKPSDMYTKAEPTAEDLPLWNQQLFQKIQAMRLRRSRRRGTVIYRDEDAAAESSRSASCTTY